MKEEIVELAMHQVKNVVIDEDSSGSSSWTTICITSVKGTVELTLFQDRGKLTVEDLREPNNGGSNGA